MAEYIDREAIYPLAKKIVDALNANGGKKYITLANDILDWIDDLPAAEIGVVEGRDGDGAKFDYCPFCGAMLREE